MTPRWASAAPGVEPLRCAGLTGAGVTLGHLDTGVAGDHPAFAGRILDFAEFDLAGDRLPPAPPRDTASHGTHTAGILCDVAPGAALRAAAVIDGGKSIVRILRGLEWLRPAPPRVLCMALGIPGDNPIFWTALAALCAADVLLVAPIGNLGSTAAHAPATYPFVLAAGATDSDGALAPYTGCLRDPRGRCRKPDVLALGDDLLSAHPRDRAAVDSGTSQAAALVAGVAALLCEACPRATGYQIEQALCRTAAPIHRRRGRRCRRGVIHPEAALALLRRDLDRLPARRRIPLDPPLYRDPTLLAACRDAAGGDCIECVVIAERALSRRDPRGAAGPLLDTVACALGVPVPEADYLPHARAAVLAAPCAFVRALIADARARVLSACVAYNKALPW